MMRAIVCLAVLVSAGAQAQAEITAVIDFESFATPGTGTDFYASPFEVDGFRFTGNFLGSDYRIHQTDSVNFAGSTALTPFATETHTLRRIDGSPFSLISFDYSEAFSSEGPGSVLFTGNFAGGGSIQQTVTSDGVFGFETANFTGFDNLSSVVFARVGSSGGFQLDNIRIVSGASAIPEPSALAVFCIVAFLSGFGAVRRRRHMK